MTGQWRFGWPVADGLEAGAKTLCGDGWEAEATSATKKYYREKAETVRLAMLGRKAAALPPPRRRPDAANFKWRPRRLLFLIIIRAPIEFLGARAVDRAPNVTGEGEGTVINQSCGSMSALRPHLD